MRAVSVVHFSSYITLITQFRKIFQLTQNSDGDTDVHSYHLATFIFTIVTHVSNASSIAVGFIFDANDNSSYFYSNSFQRGTGIFISLWQTL